MSAEPVIMISDPIPRSDQSLEIQKAFRNVADKTNLKLLHFEIGKDEKTNLWVADCGIENMLVTGRTLEILRDNIKNRLNEMKK